MKKCTVLGPSILSALLTALTVTSTLAPIPVSAGDINASASKIKVTKKFAFSLQDVNSVRKTVKKPNLVISWETRVRLANDALARDAAKVKTEVDGVLARAEQKSAECSTKNYSLQDLQALCLENEGVQACLDRLMGNCMLAKAGQQIQNSLADALAAGNIKNYLEKLKKDIESLDQALYTQQ